MTTATRMHLAVGSRLENIELVRTALESSFEALAIEDDIARDVVLAVREAVANAIRHGNGQDELRRVEVDCVLDDGVLTLEISDEGDGFDVDGVPDPLDPENLLKTSGRGLYFMRQCMDSVDYTFRPEGGTIVTMTRTLAPSRTAARSTEEE